MREITEKLAEVNFGIVCVTPENQDSNWINFEAGSLAKQVEEGRVVPFLIGMKTADLRSPLSQFQAISGESKDDVRKLIFDINDVSGGLGISHERLERAFRRSWPEYESSIRSASIIPSGDGYSRAVQRSQDDMMEEILLISRQLDQRVAEIERYAFDSDGAPRRPAREIRRISEEKFIASSFTKIGWDVIGSSWEGESVVIIAQNSNDLVQSIPRDFVERLAKSLGREVAVRREGGEVIARTNRL